jgi:1,4-alpha-glucan branching enzyme
MAKKIAAKAARHTVSFKLEDAPGRQVFVAGCFSNWEPKHKLTDRDGRGVYTGRILLAPGEYQYKFVVDGEWRLDSANPNFVPNNFGTLNSLLKVPNK